MFHLTKNILLNAMGTTSDKTLQDFLEKEICELPVSDRSIRISLKMGYHKVCDLVHDGWSGMYKKKDFSYRWFIEITDVFEQEGVLCLLEGKG